MARQQELSRPQPAGNTGQYHLLRQPRLDVEFVRLEGQRVRNVPVRICGHGNFTSRPWISLRTLPKQLWPTRSRNIARLETGTKLLLSLGQLATLLTNVAEIGGAPDRDAVKLEACQLADRVASMGQDSSYALFSAVHILTQMCGEADKAVLIARRIVTAYPNSGYNQTQLSNALSHAGQLEEALQVLANAEQAFPDNPWVFQYSPYWKSMLFTEREDRDAVLAVSGESLSLV